ncbi:MAG: family 10 glycosylhydrolase [Prevotella sp.]|nr:family 10 glycosylhydrolase [Prevotella sp.]
MKLLYTFLFSLFFTLSGYTQDMTVPIPKHEVRAVWLTTIGGLDWPHSYYPEAQKRQLCTILDKLQKANINTILLQVRIRATTIYPSVYEPFDACMTGRAGKSQSYDPLQFAIEECHRRGMEIHAWVVTIPIGKWNGVGCKQLRSRYPSLVKKIGDEGFMNPESYQTAEYLADICGEITDRYDVDGIHLDYIRYPEIWKMNTSRQQGRENITRIVRAIHKRVKTTKPWVKLSCSPIGKSDDLSRYSSNGWNAYTRVCQDAQGWLQQGLMDQLYPMMYFKDNHFFPFAIDWSENAHGRTIVPGLGIYFLSPAEGKWQLEDITRQMHVSRSLGMGQAFFRSRFLTDDTKGIYSFTANDFNRYPALVPPMTWQSRFTPPPPFGLQTTKSGVQTTISWHAPDAAEPLYYNVYAANTCPVNTDDVRNLVATRLTGCSLSLSATTQGQEHYYAVTTMNRYGNESKAIQSHEPQMRAHSYSTIYINRNRTLTLPKKDSVTDADHIVFETLSGIIVATRPYTDRPIDIHHLTDGVYVIRSVNRKGVTHRLGYFFKKTQEGNTH